MINTGSRSRVTFAVICSALPLAANVVAAQTLETETARLLPKHALTIGGAFESQTGGGGEERAVPFIIEYGITDRFELAVEPVPYTAIVPEGGARVRGAGDLEGTLSVRLRNESPSAPALAFAAEVKIPTAKNALIGTGRADYTGWAIASKQFGRFDTHANVAYTLTGSPRGIKLNNTWTGALASVFRPNAGYELFAETMATTAATSAEGGDGVVTPVTGTTSVIPPEAAGAQLFGSVGAGKYLFPEFLLFGSVSYDNTNATLLRVGMTLRLN